MRNPKTGRSTSHAEDPNEKVQAWTFQRSADAGPDRPWVKIETVLVLSNPKHEQFAQLVAKGVSKAEAAKMVGYSVARASAQGCTLAKHPKVFARIAQLTGATDVAEGISQVLPSFRVRCDEGPHAPRDLGSGAAKATTRPASSAPSRRVRTDPEGAGKSSTTCLSASMGKGQAKKWTRPNEVGSAALFPEIGQARSRSGFDS